MKTMFNRLFPKFTLGRVSVQGTMFLENLLIHYRFLSQFHFVSF